MDAEQPPSTGRLRRPYRRLVQSERLLHSSPDPMAVVDRHYVYQLVNSAYSGRYGNSPSQMEGRTVAEIVGEDVFQRDVKPHLDRCLSGHPVRYEGWFTHPETGPRYDDVLCFPLSGEGRTRFAAMAVRDVTERRLAEEALMDNERRLQAFFDNANDPICVHEVTETGSAGQILEANAAACRRFGFTREEFLLLSADSIFSLQVSDSTQETAERLSTQGHASYEAVVVSKSGDRVPVEVSASVFSHEGRKAALCIFRDISERKEGDDIRRQYVSFLSHDLRSPLTAVIGQAAMLHQQLAQAGREQEIARAEAVLKNAWRMNSMIQDLVETTRLESGQVRLDRVALDPVQAAQELLLRMAGALPVERIQMEAPQSLPPVQADPASLDRILTNLLSNALKYSEREVVVRAMSSGENVVVSVSDQGPGIPLEDQPRLFTRYYRGQAGRGPREGLGLGLYITRMLVEAHGGRIWVESEPDKGCTFSFTLPAALA
jgi:two-component system, OmpR family, phosphate regulon sensor histidine kinase PhoR